MTNFVEPYTASAMVGGNRDRTVRFDNGQACCTTTYNYSMTDDEKCALAIRIALALNLTRHLDLNSLALLVEKMEKKNVNPV